MYYTIKIMFYTIKTVLIIVHEFFRKITKIVIDGLKQNSDDEKRLQKP